MHGLVYAAVTIACSERMERLSMQMSTYTPNRQAPMSLRSIEHLD
jgi:hypothetical protein